MRTLYKRRYTLDHRPHPPIRLLIIGILAVLGFAFARSCAVGASSNDLERKISGIIRASGAETVAVTYYNLATGHELLSNPDTNFHAASTMKVPVMMEIFGQTETGNI